MTTQKQPAEPSAATDQVDQATPEEDQTSAVDPMTTESPAAAPGQPPASAPVPSTGSENAGQQTGEADESRPKVPDSPLPDLHTPAGSTGDLTANPSESPGAGVSAVSTPAQPQRRVRLNPTIAPDVAKPIPSLRPSDAPPPAPPAAAASPSSAPSAAGQPASPSAADPKQTAEEQVEAVQQADVQEPEAAAEEAAASPVPTPEPVELPARNESLDADLEAELDAALAAGEQPSAVVVQQTASAEGEEQPASAAPPTPDMEIKKGAKLTGTVASIHGDDMFLDFGLRMPGVLSRRQFGLRKQPMQGETLEVVVGRIDENEGLLHVNLPTGTSRVRGEWDALSVDQNVECMVTGTNKGGLEVSIGALRGFMPASQVELGFVPDLNVYIGQRLKARISEVNPKRRKLVLSRRSLLEEEREESQRELFEKIEPGQQYTGRVRTLKDYGAFVDIGGADGLLHVAQISWSRINHPSEVLKEGEEIQVQVLSVDKDKKKISLGMRQLTQNPWKSAESKFAQGSQVKGKVTRIENFGAFVELEEGVEGLVHISELDHKRVNKVTEVLRVGQEVDVQVLEVDPKRKRVSLSLKALKEKPEDAQDKQEAAPIKRQRSVDSLVGGMGEPTGGQLFGDPSKFGR